MRAGVLIFRRRHRPPAQKSRIISPGREVLMPLIETICRSLSYERARGTRPRDYASRTRSRGFIDRGRNRSGSPDEHEREREIRTIAPRIQPTVPPPSPSPIATTSRPPPFARFVLVVVRWRRWRWPENRFSDPLEFQAFARKRIPPIKRESPRARDCEKRSSPFAQAYPCARIVRVDVTTIGRLFSATPTPPIAIFASERERGSRKAAALRENAPPREGVENTYGYVHRLSYFFTEHYPASPRSFCYVV